MKARAINDLRRLARRWPKTLKLFSWSGSLVVFHVADDIHAAPTANDLILANIGGIPNDGGDPT